MPTRRQRRGRRCGGVEGLLDLSQPVPSSLGPSAPTPPGGSVGKGRAGGGDKPRSLSGGELQLLLGRRACG